MKELSRRMIGAGIQVSSGLRPYAFIMLVALLLSACGGGGGGGDGGTTPTATSKGSASGVVSKGIIRHGIVTAYELDASGNKLRAVGTATTDNSGRYNLTLDGNYEGGPVLLELSADGSATKMVCDVSAGCSDGANTANFGQELTLSNNFKMRAIIPPVGNGTSISAQITPFTEMATARLEKLTVAGGTVDATSVNNANAEVSQIVGLNILTVEPVDITAPSGSETNEQLVYAAFSAGAGSLISADMTQGMQDIDDAFSDGILSVTDISDLLAAIEDETISRQISIGESDNGALWQQLAVIQAQVDPTSGYDPEPPQAESTELAQAKAIVSELRTWADSVNTLDDPANAFAMDIDVAGAVFDNNSAAISEALFLITDQVFTTYANGGLVNGDNQVNILGSTGQSVGSVTVSLSQDADQNDVLAVTASDLAGLAIDLQVQLGLTAGQLAGQADISALDVALSGSIGNADASISLTDVNITASLQSPFTMGSMTDPVVTGGGISGQMTLTANGMSFTGGVDIQLVEFTGTLQATRGNTDHISISKIGLSGEFSGNGNTFTASAVLNVDNATTFDTFGFLQHQDYQYVWDSVAGDMFNFQGYAASTLGIQSIAQAYYDRWYGETCFYDQYYASTCVSGDPLGIEAYFALQYPDAMSIDYAYAELYGGYTYYSADLNYGPFETADNFAQGSLTLTLDLALDGYPETQAVLTIDRNASQIANEAHLSLIRGSGASAETVTFDVATSGSDVTITATSPSGAVLTITKAATDYDYNSGYRTFGDVTVNGAQIGAISDSYWGGVPIVRYVDGTFETLE